MSARPIKLELAGEDRLRISWNDDTVREYRFRELRDHCPCATCREKRKPPGPAEMLPIVTDADTQPLRVLGMDPVGNYAYSIKFSDGHETGIYQFELLHELGEEVN